MLDFEFVCGDAGGEGLKTNLSFAFRFERNYFHFHYSNFNEYFLYIGRTFRVSSRE
jgi:hypothetical protein